MIVAIKKIYDSAIIPTQGSPFAAGYDLYANNIVNSSENTDDKIHISPGETVMVGTGVALSIPGSYFGAIFARSGMATKRGLRPANCVGVIDSDYRGEIIVALHNDSDVEQVVDVGDRIAQIVFMPYVAADFIESEDLSRTKRGGGGFGSTGTTLLQSNGEKLEPIDYDL